VNLLQSLIDAVVRLEGEALVMHVGEKPYVITRGSSAGDVRGPLEWGHIELSSSTVTADSILGMLGRILPPGPLQDLEEMGAVEYEIPAAEDDDAQRFTVIAARGGEDLWLEVRRRRPPKEEEDDDDDALAGDPIPGSGEVETSDVAPAGPTMASGVDVPEPQDEFYELHAGDIGETGTATFFEHAEPKKVADPVSAVIVPISRPVVRPDVQAPVPVIAPLERLLRVAAARGASTVYVVAGSQPMIRVDGEISVLDGEAAFGPSDVERIVMELAPAPAHDGSRAAEWMSELPEVGRVGCVTFRDHRGAGIIFRMIPRRAISAEQLGLSEEVQALCEQLDGLVLVTGPRAGGKSTLLTSFVDLINRTRSDHVITIESQIGFVHESRRSFVSQREVRGDSEAAAAAVRSAFREDPDVMVIEDLRTPDLVAATLEAAESGRLIFSSLRASSAAAALERLIDMLPPDRRAHAQGSLAGSLRGVVAQVLLRRVGGGRIAAREVLLNTPAVAGLIAEGRLYQLPIALDSGGRQGMVSLNESLASLVRAGTVQASEACRKTADRKGLLVLFKRDGVDTSFAERLA
jgi:twitching motility protein PilT